MKKLLFLLIAIPFAAIAFQITYPYPFADYPQYPVETDDGVTVIIINDSDPADWGYEIPFGYNTMRDLWNSMVSEDAHFTIRAGDEYLVYSRNTLVYTRGDLRCNITIYPEELWYIMSHCYRPMSPVTGEISMQAWFPGMDESETSFLTLHDPAMSVIQLLLQRGRDTSW